MSKHDFEHAKKRFYGGKKAKRLEAVIDQAVSP